MSKQQKFNMTLKEVTTTEEEQGIVIISGYANRYKNEEGEVVIDRSWESVAPFSYNLLDYLKNPVVLFDHDVTKPVGKALAVEMKPEGLYVKIAVYRDVNSEIYAAVKNGVLRTLSIGFRAKDYKIVDDDIWVWTEVDLYEISIVAIPDNQDSIFTVSEIKSCANGECALVSKSIDTSLMSPELREEISKQLCTMKTEINESNSQSSSDGSENNDNGSGNDDNGSGNDDNGSGNDDNGSGGILNLLATDTDSVTTKNNEPEPTNEPEPIYNSNEITLEQAVEVLRAEAPKSENFDTILSIQAELTQTLNQVISENI